MLEDHDATQAREEQIRAQRLRLAVGIPTVGRPTVLAGMLKRLRQQKRPSDSVVVCAPSAADFEGVAEAFPDVTLLIGPHGLAHQRNAILRHLDDFDVVVFFDDDFVPCRRYLESVEKIMLDNPDVVMTTGHVLADGIGGAGLTFEAADATLKEALLTAPSGSLDWVYNGYGCNMSVRLAPVRQHALAFDERLPLYGWLEDVDFSQRLAGFGRLVRSDATRGIHLGIKLGRSLGMPLGYSQIANPFYLMRKGTMSWRRGLAQMGRNIAKNALYSVRPEAWVDRRGRLHGNARALLDLAWGRIDPARIERFRKMSGAAPTGAAKS
jgi:GT2 family glycosyltransferase